VLKRTVPLCLVFAACHTGTDLNEVPSFVVPGSVTSTPYDGNNDDLLTGGLGALGLTGFRPTFVTRRPRRRPSSGSGPST